MLGIVIATHGKLSDGLKDSAEVIIGATDNIATVNLNHGEDIQQLGAKISEATQKVDQGDGIIILTDVISASPYNQSLMVVSQMNEDVQTNTYVIGGVNLPMLLETINHQILSTPVNKAAKAIVDQGAVSMSLWHASMVADDEDEEDEF
ncbi:PTS sugar transporter subunit IIA [Enterococcus alishanensis]